MFALLLLALSVLPQPDGLLRDRCDVIEVNHFFDEYGRLVFDQQIFYDWCQCDERYQVIAWRLVKHEGQLPRFDYARGAYVSQWQDGEVMRRVESQAVRETWTQHDPEILERTILSTNQRRRLRGER